MAAIRFKAKYHVEQIPGEGTLLISEKDSFLLEGNHLDLIVPLLRDGRYSVDDIVQAAQPLLSPEETVSALEVLRQAGHLEEVDLTPLPFAAFWSELGLTHDRALHTLTQHPIEVSIHGAVEAMPFLQTAAGFGLSLGTPAKVHVALADDYLRPSLFEVNRACLSRGTPLLLVKPVGVRLCIGPLMLPGLTGCWRCLENRLRNNREIEAYIERRTGKPQPLPVTRARLPLMEMQASTMAVTQLVRLFTMGHAPSLTGRILVADIIDLSFEEHTLTRRPQCPDCGNPHLPNRAGLPVRITSQLAAVDSTSGLRSSDPEETFRRFQHHISPLTGVVREVVPSAWHGVGPLRVYMAGHNFALKNDQLYFLKDGLRTSSSGKGRTDAQARTSALCEALERYSGIFRGDEPRVRTSLRELGEDAVDPRTCMLFSERQYEQRLEWLARGSRFQVVPLPFLEERPVEWTPVWSMTHQGVRFLPTSYLFYNHQAPQEEFFCWADSNGAAAGASPEEAMLQGLLELIERDAVALWWYNRLRRPAVDLASFSDKFLEEVREFYLKHDREYWVLDLTFDTGIPAFVAINRRKWGPTEDIMLGFGAHMDAHTAVLRAVTEMNQFIPAVLSVNPDGTTLYGIRDRECLHWWQTATLENQPYLSPDPSLPPRTASDYAASARAPAGPDIGAVLQNVIGTLEGLGHEVLALDQTRADIGLPVYKMIVPGFRHFWARFAPGRLYDVPVRMGLLPTQRSESELNPIPMFL